MTDLELTARVKAVVPSGPASDSLVASQPRPGEVVIEAHPTSNFVVVITPEVRRTIDAAVRELLPDLVSLRFDPHH